MAALAAHAHAGRPGSAKLSIGQVLEHLAGDFADLTPSKLRFLEEQGLITPERTPSGYRKFTQVHIERLRLILTLQRDHYLPLKVIAELLDEVDAGKDPIIPGTQHRPFSSILTPQRVLSRDELLRLTGASSSYFAEAVAAGLLPAAEVYPHETIAQLRALLELHQRGLSPRHLRTLRANAEREVDMLQHSAAARGTAHTSPEAVERALETAALLDTVRTGIVRNRIHNWKR